MTVQVFAAGQNPSITETEQGTLRMIAYAHRSTASTAASAAQGVLLLDNVPITLGRAYWVVTNTLIVLPTVANDRGTARLAYRDDGVAAGTASALFAIGNTGQLPTGDGQSVTLSGLYVPTATSVELSLMLFTQRLSGTGNISLFAGVGGIQIMVYDAGPCPVETGQRV